MTGSEVVERSPRDPETALCIYISLSWRQEEEFQRQTSCATQNYIHSGHRMGGIQASALYFSSLHSILNKQTYWEEYFFLFLRKHLQSWKEIKTVISKMKTKQCSGLDDRVIGGQSSASCWVPGTGPLGQLRKSTGDSQNGHCLSETHLSKQ